MLNANRLAGIRDHYRCVRLLCCLTLILCCVVALLPRPAGAAAPWIIIVHGEQLNRPVILSDIDLNAAILGSPTQSEQEFDLSNRRYFELALFWGPEWLDFVASGESPFSLTPDQANQHGKFYPATGSDEAVVALDAPSILAPAPSVSQPSPEGLEILRVRGVPIRLESDSSTWTSVWNEPLLWGFGLTAVLLVGSLFAARARDPERKLGPGASYGYR